MEHRELYRQGVKYLREKNFPLALDALLGSLEQKPDDVYTLNKLAQTYSSLGDSEKAQATLEHVFKLQKEDLYTQYQMGNLFMQKKQLKEAEAYFKKGLALDKNDSYCKNSLALVYRMGGHLKKAIGLLEENIRQFPDDPYNYNGLVLCYMDSFDYPKARSLCEDALERHPRSTYTLNLYSQILEFIGDLQGAAESYRKVLKLDEGNPVALHGLGDLYLKEGASMNRFKLFIFLGENRDLNNHLTRIRECVEINNQSSLTKALDLLNKLVSLYPQNGTFQGSLALALLLSGQFTLSREAFQISLSLEGENPFAHYNLGFLSLLQGKLDLAIGHLEKSVEQDPKDLYARNFLGYLLLTRGFYEKANKVFYQALKISKEDQGREDGFSLYGLAMICQMGSDNEGSMGFFNTIQRLYPDSLLAKRSGRNLSLGL